MSNIRLYFSILAITIVIIIVLVFTDGEKEAREKGKKIFLNLDFTGYIVKKEIDKK